MGRKRTSRALRRRRIARAVPTQEMALTSSQLEALPGFNDLVPTPKQLEAFERASARLQAQGLPLCGIELGCVVRLDRGFPVVACTSQTLRCEYGQGLSSLKTDMRAAVGDWVVCRKTNAHDAGMLLEEVLPRTSDIARWRGGNRGERQTLAANVHTVLVVQPLSTRPLLIDRIARSVVIALDCGARPAVVLTKADRCPRVELAVAQLERLQDALTSKSDIALCVTGKQVPDEFVRSIETAGKVGGYRWGIDAVRNLLPQGEVAIMLGESGAGKSTLLNALYGRDVLAVGDVRATDDAGRHTTVSRRMIKLPGAGVVVDEPGLRSLPLVGHEQGLAKAFPEIVEAARACRFRDCTHTSEPGCAVQHARAQGTVTQARLDVYKVLAHEMRRSAQKLDPDVVL